MDIVIQTEIDEKDSEHLFKWAERVFPEEGKDYLWSQSTHHIIARDNGKPVGHIGFAEYRVIGETEKNVIGVGGVVVRPEHQGKKIPAKMFEVLNSTDTLNAGDSVKTLFCPKNLVSYYQGHGYQEHTYGFRFMQKQGYATSDRIHFLFRGELGLSCNISIPSFPW